MRFTKSCCKPRIGSTQHAASRGTDVFDAPIRKARRASAESGSSRSTTSVHSVAWAAARPAAAAAWPAGPSIPTQHAHPPNGRAPNCRRTMASSRSSLAAPRPASECPNRVGK
eukprot:scaffold32727_cov174-Isochrysis_galbana.AAC.1